MNVISTMDNPLKVTPIAELIKFYGKQSSSILYDVEGFEAVQMTISLVINSYYSLNQLDTDYFTYWYFICTALWILIENTYGNEVNNIREHLQKVFHLYGAVGKLGIRRFQMLFHAFHPNLDELRQLTSMLSDAAKRVFHSLHWLPSIFCSCFDVCLWLVGIHLLLIHYNHRHIMSKAIMEYGW